MLIRLLSKINFKEIYLLYKKKVYEIIFKIKNIKNTNYNLGIYHLNNNNINDAILRFKIVIYLDRSNANAYFYLGKSQFIKGDLFSAEKNLLKSIEIDSNLEESKYFLSLFNNNYAFPFKIPLTVIKDYYNNKTYNLNFNENGDFEFLIEKLIKYSSDPRRILDIGFGEGDLGYSIRNKFTDCDITGVELSIKAIDSVNKKIKNKIIYNTIIEQDYYRFLSEIQEKYDIIFAIDSLHFDRNLANIFDLIRKKIEYRGILVIKLKKSSTDNTQPDLNKKYFTYSKPYIDEALSLAGFNILFFGQENNDLIYISNLK